MFGGGLSFVSSAIHGSWPGPRVDMLFLQNSWIELVRVRPGNLDPIRPVSSNPTRQKICFLFG